MNGHFNLQQSDYSANKGMNGNNNLNDDKASMLFEVYLCGI